MIPRFMILAISICSLASCVIMPKNTEQFENHANNPDMPSVEWADSILGIGGDLIQPNTDYFIKGHFAANEENLFRERFEDFSTYGVISYIADYADFNVTMDDSVDGKTTVDFRGLSWFESLLKVIEANDLNMCSMNNIILISKDQALDCDLGYTGERLSMNFQLIEVRSVLQLLDDFSNIVVVPCEQMMEIDNEISIRLRNVRWDEAFDTVLQIAGLLVGRIDDFVLIKSKDTGVCEFDFESASQRANSRT